MSFVWEINTEKAIEMKQKLDFMEKEFQRQMSGRMVSSVPGAKRVLESAISINSAIVAKDKVLMNIHFPGIPGYNMMLSRELKKVIKNVDENADVKEIKENKRSILDKIRRKGKSEDKHKTESLDSEK